jgi:hypothetical protein
LRSWPHAGDLYGSGQCRPIADKLMADGLAPTPRRRGGKRRAPRDACCARLWRGWANWSREQWSARR